MSQRGFSPTFPPRRFRQFPIWAAILVLAFTAWRVYQQPARRVSSDDASVTVRVQKVFDGDTLLIDGNQRVRLLGVDTPETVKPETPIQPWGPEASDFTKRHVEGRMVRLEFDHEKRDRYNRILAYVYVDQWLLNEELIRAGLSPAVTKFPYREEMKQRFRAAEAEARRNKVGIWSSRKGP